MKQTALSEAYETNNNTSNVGGEVQQSLTKLLQVRGNVVAPKCMKSLFISYQLGYDSMMLDTVVLQATVLVQLHHSLE